MHAANKIRPPANTDMSRGDTLPLVHFVYCNYYNYFIFNCPIKFKGMQCNAYVYRRLPQVETNTDLDRPPSEEEVKKEIKQLSTGKAPGADAIPAEVYKHGGDTPLQKLTDLFCRMWDEEVLAAQSCVHHPPLQKGKSPAL